LDFSQIVIQSSLVRRYGYGVELTGSDAQFGTEENSVNLEISLSIEVVANMIRNGVGLNTTNSLLSFTDKFLSDPAGNFVPPLWDSSIMGYEPLQPGTFVKDQSPPELTSWFMDVELNEFYLTFFEPVTLLDGDLIEIFPSSTGQGLLAGNGETLANATARALTGTNTIIITVPNRCDGISIDGTCQGTDFLTRLAQETNPLWIAIKEGAVQDFSEDFYINVAVEATAPIRGGSPNCGSCPDGEYVSLLCTSNTDRVCTQCTLCPVGEYESVVCQPDQDTRCASCTACPYGKYVSTACEEDHDVSCSACTECTASEYEASACTGVLDTACVSCNTCEFTTEASKIKCETGMYLYWYNANCCQDAFSRTTVPCNQVGFALIKAASTTGRHHWAYPDTSPAVATGYEFGTNF